MAWVVNITTSGFIAFHNALQISLLLDGHQNLIWSILGQLACLFNLFQESRPVNQHKPVNSIIII